MDRPAGSARACLVLGLWLALAPVSHVLADPAGRISHLTGILTAERGDGTRTLLSLGSIVHSGDVLDSAHNTYARIKFLDDSELILRPDSRVKIERYRFVPGDPPADRSLIQLLKGGLRRVSGLIGKRNPAEDTLQTPVAIVGIRGTHYGLLLCQQDCGGIPTPNGVPLKDGLHADVARGHIVLRNPAGEITIGAGQFAYVQDHATPPLAVPPGEGVKVTAPAAVVRNRGKGQTLDTSRCNGECVVR
jgi:hypothetical protein